MNKILLSLIVFSVLSLAFMGCNTSNKRKLSETQIDSIRTSFKMAEDSLQMAWDIMIEDDDLKIADLKRLIDEMENTGQYEKPKLDSLRTDLQTMVDARYDQMGMSVSAKIDEYDSITFAMTNKLLMYAKTQPAYESYTIIHLLETDILDANDRILNYRIYYDSWAKLVNLHLTENKEHLHLDTSNEAPIPLFELSE